MQIYLDTCTLLNLINGEVLQHVLAFQDATFFVSREVERESESERELIRFLVNEGLLEFADDALISFDLLNDKRVEWGLGIGECETILVAAQSNGIVACDDSKARNRIEIELGNNRLTGSLGFLQKLVYDSVLSQEDAYNAYLRMRANDGFLMCVTP